MLFSARAFNKSKSVHGRERENGFTLIELIVVIVVLGILSGIAFFSVRGVREAGVVRACNENAVQLLKAFEAFNIDMGYYPGKRNVGDAFTSTDVNELVTAGFIRTNFINSSPDYKLSATLTDGGSRVVGQFTLATDKTCEAP